MASPEAKTILYVCVNKSSGQLFYLEPCKKQGQTKTDVTSTSTPFKACYLASNGVTRKVSESTKCSNKTTNKEITIPEVPAHPDSLYFCVGTDGTMYFKPGTTEPTCAAGQYAVVIGPHNQPPVPNASSATTNEDNSVTITLTGSDLDGDALTFEIVAGPTNGSLGSIIPTGPSTATVQYTPNSNYNGGDSFTYKAKDGLGGEGIATVTITVNAVNDAPSFTAGGDVTVNEDSGAYSKTWATNISAGPANESGQTVSFNVIDDNHTLFASGGQPAISSDGTLTFTPAANRFGDAFVEVDAKDNGGTANGGKDTSTQTFTITVNAVNDAPSFTAGGDVTVNEDSGAYSKTWATAISAGPNEFSQTVSFNVSNNNNALFSSQPAISSTGTLTFTPADNANGTATVNVTATDNGGTANGGHDTSDTKTFTITVNAVNDAPVANNDTYNVNEGGSLSVPPPGVLGNDTDPDGDPLIAELVSAPVHASSFSLNINGSFDYTHDGSETTSDFFTYSVNDGTAVRVATVEIDVAAVNDAPVANNDAYSVNEGGTLNVGAPGLLGNDTDTDSGTLKAVLVSSPAHATNFTLNPDGSFSYTHDGSETTSDSFTYKANDGSADSNVTTVTITVTSPP